MEIKSPHKYPYPCLTKLQLSHVWDLRQKSQTSSGAVSEDRGRTREGSGLFLKNRVNPNFFSVEFRKANEESMRAYSVYVKNLLWAVYLLKPVEILSEHAVEFSELLASLVFQSSGFESQRLDGELHGDHR